MCILLTNQASNRFSEFSHLHQEAGHFPFVNSSIAIGVYFGEDVLYVFVAELAVGCIAKGVADECSRLLNCKISIT